LTGAIRGGGGSADAAAAAAAAEDAAAGAVFLAAGTLPVVEEEEEAVPGGTVNAALGQAAEGGALPGPALPWLRASAVWAADSPDWPQADLAGTGASFGAAGSFRLGTGAFRCFEKFA
jgi:hypothetical protein